MEELKIDPSREIGEGSFGVVYDVGENRAFKKFNFMENEGIDHSFIRELAMYQYFSKYLPDVIPTFHKAEVNEKFPGGGILMDKYDYTLTSLPSAYLHTHFTEIAKKLIVLLCKWSSHGISHRDIKPCNIIINIHEDRDRAEDLRIIDWGASCFKNWSTSAHGLTTCICTLWYRPIELLLGARKYDPYALDVWSVGITLIQLWCKIRGKEFNLEGKSEVDQILKIIYHFGRPSETSELRKLPEWTDEFPKIALKHATDSWTIENLELADLINKMLILDPKDRIKIIDIMNHPFIKDDIAVVNSIPILSISDPDPKIELKIDKALNYESLFEIMFKTRLNLNTIMLTLEMINFYIHITGGISNKEAVTMLLITSKMCELYALDIEDILYHTKKQFTRSEIIACEQKLLSVLPDSYHILINSPIYIALKFKNNDHERDPIIWIGLVLLHHLLTHDKSVTTIEVASAIIKIYDGALNIATEDIKLVNKTSVVFKTLLKESAKNPTLEKIIKRIFI